MERHPAVIVHDLPEIYARIAQDNVGAAERVLDAVEATFAQISTQPECGVPYPTRIPRMKAVRMLPVRGFNEEALAKPSEISTHRTHHQREL